MRFRYPKILFYCGILVFMLFMLNIVVFERLVPFHLLKKVLLLRDDERAVYDKTNTMKQQDSHAAENRQSIYDLRRRAVIEGCKKMNRTHYESIAVRNNIKIDPVHNICYCPIQKVGSTFWIRTLTVLSSKGKLNSPFEIGRGQVELDTWRRNLAEKERKVCQNGGETFIFVRDPYARLFSGYENKIYHVNPSFWKSYGREIVQSIRGQTDTEHMKYGFDVTFPEFIKFILRKHDNNEHINIHFRPMHQMCDPCNFKYDYVGHQETFADDAKYLLTKWRREFNDFTVSFDDFEKETAIDTAKSRIGFLFHAEEFLDEIKFPFVKLMLRTWRDLQIRGYLSKTIDFPFTGDVSSVTKADFLDAVVKSLEQPQNWTAVKLQRNEALVQAYRQVPLEDMERLRQFLLPDCLLFGYSDRPSKYFDRSSASTDDFLYLDGLS